MAPWRYPDYLPKPPHLMTEADWAEYRQGLSKQQMSERYSGITSDLIPTFEMIQAQGAGDIDPDPYKRQRSRELGLSPGDTSDVAAPDLSLQQSASNNAAFGKQTETSPYGTLFRKGIMKAGEHLRHDLIFSFLEKFNNKIESSASAYGIDSGVVKAIIFEEQSHLMPLEMILENELGIGSTIGAGQITEGMYGHSREELADPSINIDVIARHLSQLQDEGLIDPSRPVASLGSRYNNGLTKDITSYGMRVEGFYNRYFAG